MTSPIPQSAPSNALTPHVWVGVANERRPKLPHTTEWFDGTTHPSIIGWYERHFTDSMNIGDCTMQWWDGELWRPNPNWTEHWRQVGDYPAWRGRNPA